MPVKGKKKSKKKSKSKRPSLKKVSLFDGYDMGVGLLGGPFAHTDPFGMMMPAPFPHPLMMPSPSISMNIGDSLGLSSGIKIDDGYVMKNHGIFAPKPSGLSLSLKSSSTNPAAVPGVAPPPVITSAFTGGKKKTKTTSKRPGSKKKPGASKKKSGASKKKSKKSKKKGHDNIY